MSAKRLLILGGTTEASALVRRLGSEAEHVHTILSFAGRTAIPQVPNCEVRIGGFGGVDGLSRYLRDERIDAVIDATHPFAARMRWNVFEACTERDIPRLRLERGPWRPQAGDLWLSVPNMDQASAAIAWSQRIFLTIGRQELAAFSGYEHKWFLVRAIEKPDLVPPLPGEILLARGPFTVEDEIELINTWRIDTIVSKNSGGEATEAKITAARRLGIKVVMVERPPNPAGRLVETVAEACAWLDQLRS
jgi:precorrin-6A/cobalt-precorrin-6A reductase